MMWLGADGCSHLVASSLTRPTTVIMDATLICFHLLGGSHVIPFICPYFSSVPDEVLPLT